MTDTENPRTSRLDPDGTMPTLGDWLTLNEAAGILGVSRQHFYTLMQTHEWSTARRIGTSRVVVVREAEVRQFKADRDARLAAKN